jgi:hypothetical protein
MKTKKTAKAEVKTTEIEDVRQSLAEMRVNARLAAADIAKRGLSITTMVTDNNGKLNKVERVNPMVRIQREALRSIASLRRQLALLEEEEQNAGKGTEASDWESLDD